MAASINDKFTEATNGSRPVPTTLTALLPSGASPGTATCGALTGWATATAVHFIIYTVDVNGRKVSGSQTDWKGVVSGSTITGLVLKAGTNNGYSIGAVVEAAPTAAWADDVTEGIMVEHNQNGTHNAVTAASVTATGTVQGATLIATGDIQHRSVSLETIRSHLAKDFVQSGCVWTGDSYGSTRAASMTAGVVYIGGKRVAVSSVSARTFTASKDTYIDVGNTGTLTYTEVSNNAASPSLAANSIRLGTVVTAAGSIAAATSIGQGLFTNTAPVISSQVFKGFDSLGNKIYPKGPSSPIIGQNPCMFSVYLAANQTGVGDATFTKVAWNTKRYDVGLNFDATTNRRFTAPVAGFYQLFAYLSFTYSGGAVGVSCITAMYVNGAEVRRADTNSTSAGVNSVMSAQLSEVLQLAAGDYVEIYGYSDVTSGTVNIIGGAIAARFTGYLLSAS